MTNRWVEFVKIYAKEKNISYNCAMCEIKTKNLYKPLKKEEKPLKGVLELPRTADPKIFSKMIKVKKPKKIEKKQKQKEEEEEKEIENPDIISNELQKLLFVSGTEKIKNALNKLKFKGRLQTNPIMRNLQILQNFNTIEKMIELIKELIK